MEFAEKNAEIEDCLGQSLPAQYVQFLLAYSEKIIGDRVLLYSVEDLIERNSTYETKAYCPGYLAIGDDSGGRAFVIPIANWTGSVFGVDHADMSEDGFVFVTTNFQEWIRNDCRLHD